MIQPTALFNENLARLHSIEGLAGIELFNSSGALVAKIDNAPGKAGSLAVYNYLLHVFGHLNPDAATHGLEVFGEHTADAKDHPGAHPSIDRLFDVIETMATLTIKPISA